MSEDVRKNLRTQGKYNDDKSRKSREKKQKVTSAAKESPETKSVKRNSDSNKMINSSLDEDESSLKYEENSDYSFNELKEVEKSVEIVGCGVSVLSQTEHGESKIIYEPRFLHEDEGNDYYDRLRSTINWHEKNIVINGIEYPQPRLVAWFGPYPYTYSGTTLESAEMPDAVLEIKRKIEEFLKHKDMETTFNSVLLNLYRDNKDSVAWHSDDELTLGISPTIASISLGETRKFEIRRKAMYYDDQSPCDQKSKYFVHLTHGSLIIMSGAMQDDWQHRVPKEYHDKRERINLTFRTVHPLEKVPEHGPIKETNMGTTKKQSNGHYSSNKISSCDYKLDDEEHFPPLNSDINPANPSVNCNMLEKNKHHSPTVKSDDSLEECWDSEISIGDQNAHFIAVHKNIRAAYSNEDGKCKVENYGESTLKKNKPPRMQQSFESYSENDSHENTFDKKTASMKLCYSVNNLSENCFQENKIDKNENQIKCHKSLPNSLMNDNQGKSFRNKNDLKQFHHRRANFITKDTQENTANKKDYSRKSINIETSSFVNAIQENDLDKREPPNTCYSRETNLHLYCRENNLDKKPSKMGLNVDAKEFIPNNIKTNEINQFNELELENLIHCNIHIMEGKILQDHTIKLREKVSKRVLEISRFDRDELDFLCTISDGSQTDKNQKLISLRICKIVKNNLEGNRASSNVRTPFDGNSRQRGYENQNHYSDRGRKFHNQRRNNNHRH